MKKILVMLIVALLTLTYISLVASANLYSPSKWALEANDNLELTWYENPRRNVEKGEFMFAILRMIQNSYERRGEYILESNSNLDFYDSDKLSNDEQKEAAILVDLGVLSGYNGYMNLNSDIKRGEAAKVLNYFNSELGLEFTRKIVTFSDCEEHWAKKSIENAYKIGLVNGTSKNNDGTLIFEPNKNLTIEELVQIMYNISNMNCNFSYEDIACALVNTFDVDTKLETNISNYSSTIFLNVGDKITYLTNTDGIWTSNNLSCVSVDSYGNIIAKSPGKAIVSRGNINITIYVEAPTKYIEIGEKIKLSNNLGTTWKSDNKNIATVNFYGEVTGISAGTTTVRFSDSEFYTIKVADTTVIELKIGETENLGNTTSKWSSSDTSVATVSQKGIITAINSGIATISNRYSKYTIIVPNVSNIIMNIDDSVQFNNYTNFKVSNSKIVNVANNKFTAISAGDTTISNDSVTINIYVAKKASYTENITLTVGETYSISKKYGDWTSSNTKVATVSDYGKITAKSVGSAIITNEDTGYEYYVTVIRKNSSSDIPNYDDYDSDILIYADGYEPSSYYNAFVGDTVKIIVYSADSKLKSVNISNSKCTLEKGISSLGNNKYTFTVSAESAGACVLTLNFNDGNHTEFTINAFKD